MHRPPSGCACSCPLRRTSSTAKSMARPRSGPRKRTSTGNWPGPGRSTGGTTYGDLLSAAIAANPPRERSQVWAQRDQKIAVGRATPEEIGAWALDEAKALANEENRKVTAARRKAWNDWVATSWTRSPSKVYAWCKTERPAPILSTTDAQGTSKPCPGTFTMTWRRPSPRSKPNENGQQGSQALLRPYCPKRRTTGRWPKGPSAFSHWFTSCGQQRKGPS